MSEPLVIASHTGPYQATFDEDALERLDAADLSGLHFIIDARVAKLYGTSMARILASPSVLLIDAVEESKSLERVPAYVEHLVGKGARRDHALVAIGGGITQDITCFLAATMLRGMDWRFLPTTLLAQADSCIGSKSSINCGSAKNILGTFTPPRQVSISSRFLATLDERDVRSGVGEMLKVHAIEGPAAFDTLAAEYPRLFSEPAVMIAAIHRSLAIKKRYIEEDEFDRGVRNVFNYGHSFGHAIEAATQFAIPHGIAVTIGMDMANHMARCLDVADDGPFERMHPVLAANFRGFERHPVPLDPLLAALAKDKKNVGQGSATVILPDSQGRIARSIQPVDERFRAAAKRYLDEVRPS